MPFWKPIIFLLLVLSHKSFAKDWVVPVNAFIQTGSSWTKPIVERQLKDAAEYYQNHCG